MRESTADPISPKIAHFQQVLALDVGRGFRYNLAFHRTVLAVPFYLLDLNF